MASSAVISTGPNYGAAQTLIVVGKFGLNDPVANPTNKDAGVKVSFDVAGRVTGVRYKRLSSSAGTLTIRAWNDTTTTKVGEIADTRSTSGQYTVTFPTPVLVTTSGTWTFTYGASGGVPASGIDPDVTNTADMNYVAMRSSVTFGNYPTINEPTGNTYYVEPIFEPEIP
jgi:hypothetical protein